MAGQVGLYMEWGIGIGCGDAKGCRPRQEGEGGINRTGLERGAVGVMQGYVGNTQAGLK